MYAFIDGFCFISSIVAFVLTFVYNVPQFCPLPILFFILYSVLLEFIYNTVSKLCGSRVQYRIGKNAESQTQRIVYCDDYNISFCGIQKMHPFDSQKYGNIFAILENKGILTKGSVLTPSKISRSLLLEKMSMCYLLKLNYSIFISKCIEMPLFFVPAFLLRMRLLSPMLLATQGTILSCMLALPNKWAINLSGGYHHASCNSGGGFCIYPDISLAVHYLQTRYNIGKVMIIDLDAHQGNGHEKDFIGRQDVYIVDIYNHSIYPNDSQARKAIRSDFKVRPSTSNQQYIKMVKSIGKIVEQFQPGFVIYNAGSDCLIGDPLGGLSLSEETLVERDQIIIEICLKFSVPVSMVLSGGYQKINASVIAKSVQNLYNKFY